MTYLNAPIRFRRVAAAALVVVLTAVGGVVLTPGVASAATFSSFSAGVFAPLQVKHYWWNNANSDAYAPGLEGVTEADPNVSCTGTVNRTWYVRQPSGEREFHLEIEGDPVARCRLTVWLARLSMFRESSTGTLNPGQSRAWLWNNARSAQNIYLVGVYPAQVEDGACAIEVSTQYRTQPNGENEFIYRAKNVGDVACSADLRHVKLGVDDSYNLLGPISGTIGVFDTLPAGIRVVVPGAVPAANPDGPATFSLGPLTYLYDDLFRIKYTNNGAANPFIATYAWL